MKPSHSKRCAICGNEFQNRVARAKYCSEQCRITGRERFRVSREYPLSAGTVGAIGEMLVCADLLLAGYEVFRAVSPSCGCDVVACKGGRILRVEVRTVTGTVSKIGAPVPPQDAGRIHVYAIVGRAGEIYYYPDLIPERDFDVDVFTPSFIDKADASLIGAETL